ncbi:uncharacterized protein LOC142929848 isoform X1 [Petromyzon marinus]|uniref:uncharacterized protein LOC116937167 isoform X1 n=2 Tax=Petromyzon marinus TaxID=7757 RepID=UPI003F72AAC0
MRPVAATPGHLAPRSAPGPRRGTTTTSSAMRARTAGAPERTFASRQRGGAAGAPEGGVGGPEGAAAAFRERAASSKERTARARESRTAAASLLLLLMAASASIPPGASGRHTMSTTPPSSGLQVRPADPIDPADSIDPDHLADLIAPTAPPALTSAAEDDARHQQHDSRLGWAPGVPGPLRRVLLRTERSLHGERRSRLGKKGGRGRGNGGGGRGRKADQSCRLRVVQVTVRELGLGYDSDETLRFKYCGGSCRQDRNMYQMVLEHLLDLKGDLVASRSSAQPCCRPVGFEDVSFMDSSLEWKTLENVSANGCRCLR